MVIHYHKIRGIEWYNSAVVGAEIDGVTHDEPGWHHRERFDILVWDGQSKRTAIILLVDHDIPSLVQHQDQSQVGHHLETELVTLGLDRMDMMKQHHVEQVPITHVDPSYG